MREIEQFSKQLIDIFNRRKWQDAYSLINQISHSEPSIFSLRQGGNSEISNGSKLYELVQQWRYILHKKRIETFSHGYITEFVRNMRRERGWGVNDFLMSNPLRIYQGDFNKLTMGEEIFQFGLEKIADAFQKRAETL